MFIVIGINAETVSFQSSGKDIEVSFSAVKGETDTTIKIVYDINKTAYLAPLDANRKQFSELKYYNFSNNYLRAIYYSATNGVVAYSYTLDKKDGCIKVTSSSSNCYLQLRLDADALIIPDPITDDELFWPIESPEFLRVPGDNHLFVKLLDKGNAMLTCAWDYSEQEIIVSRSKSKTSFSEATFTCTPNGNIWFNFLKHKNIWYKPDMKLTEEYVSVNWTPPFPAMWHVIFKREKGLFPIEDNLCDMWVLLVRDKKIPAMYTGMGLYNAEQMTAWVSRIGAVPYPCFIENSVTRLSLPPFSRQNAKRIKYDNEPTVIYPFSSLPKHSGSQEIPSNILFPLDVACKFSGKDCIEKLCFRLNNRFGFPATCGITDKLEKIFYRGDAEIQKNQEYIKKSIELMDMFVYSVNAQLKENIEFAKTLQAWLENQKEHYPTLSTLSDKYIKELQEIEKYYIIKEEVVKTPAYYMTLSKKLGDLIETKLDEEEKEKQSKALGRDIRSIGGAQDGVSVRQRTHLKAIKQQATLDLIKTNDPIEIEFMQQFRKRLNNRLRIRGMMEGK